MLDVRHHSVPVLSTRVCYCSSQSRSPVSTQALGDVSFGSEIISAKSPIKQPGRRNQERAREERACVSYGLTETSPWFGPDQYTIYCHWTPETTAWSRSIKEQRLSLIINEEGYDTGAQEAKHTVCNVLFPSLSRRALLQTLLIYIRPAVFAQWL